MDELATARNGATSHEGTRSTRPRLARLVLDREAGEGLPEAATVGPDREPPVREPVAAGLDACAVLDHCAAR